MLELTGLSKFISRYLAVTPLFFLFAMVAFNRDNRDYFNYERAFYDEYFRDSFEPGYGLLIEVLKSIGLGHEGIIFIAGSLLIVTMLRMLKGSLNVNLVVFFYCAFPLIYDINQTRNLIMYLVLVLALIYVVENKKIKFYLMMLTAASFHLIGLFYIPFYWFSKWDRKKFMRVLKLTTITLGIGAPLVITGLSLLFPDKAGYYLNRPPGYGIILYFVCAIFDYFTVWWVDKKIGLNIVEDEKPRMEVMYRFVWFPVISLPFLFFFAEFSRIQRNVLLVKYIYCAIAMKYMNIKQRLITVFLLLIPVSIYTFVVFQYRQFDLYNYLDENFIKYYLDRYF
ncbi:EpsG family protein [Paenibacillus agaridevorans]|uniref:EpsG family protein n=1 Tax=Paenibacillus agaridevorans TaxID=171404 RepID=UPI0011B28E99|nr:EpsG family protein [Paenibacillus agaridevorans]